MNEKKLPDADVSSIPSFATEWFQQFLRHLKINFRSISQKLTDDTELSEQRLTAMRAVKLTLIDSGIDLESFIELFGQVAFEESNSNANGDWTAELNRR